MKDVIEQSFFRKAEMMDDFLGHLSPVLAVIIVLAGAAVAPAQERAKVQELQVLFIGNSQIYFNDLPRMVEALAESGPVDRPRIRADRFVSGGASLASLWNKGDGNGTARAKIVEKKWDFVILQDIYFVKPDAFNKYAPLFHELIHKNGSRTILFCTASVSSQYPKGFQELHEMHFALGKKLGVPVAAAGKAWLTYWGETPTAEERLALYHADKAHPGVKGSYIYACTLYAALTGHTPVGLTNRIPKQPEDTVTAAEAKKFQEVAWRIHQDVNRAAPAGNKLQCQDKASVRSVKGASPSHAIFWSVVPVTVTLPVGRGWPRGGQVPPPIYDFAAKKK